MKRLRLQTILIVAWIYLVSSADGWRQPLPINALTGTYALGITLLLIAAPRLQRLPRAWLAWPPAVLFLVLKAALGYPIAGASLAETLVDLAVVLVTTLLAMGAARSVNEFYGALAHAVVDGLRGRPRPFARAQGHLYREIRRARLGRQPLMLLAVTPRPESVDASRPRFLEEAMLTLSRDYIQGRVAEFLREELRICDTIALVDGHLVTILPVTTHLEASEIVRHLQEHAEAQLGLKLAIGKASFPDEEVTLVGLLQRAETEMHCHVRHGGRPEFDRSPHEKVESGLSRADP